MSDDGFVEDSLPEVAVRDIHLLRASAIDVRPGGMESGNGVAHVRVLDIPNERMFIIPVSRMALNAMMGQITFSLSQSEPEEDAHAEHAQD